MRVLKMHKENAQQTIDGNPSNTIVQKNKNDQTKNRFQNIA